MSLATRCPSCSTVFRVVQDQLRVSEGWVRCGRCGEAFNALEAMLPWPPTPLAAAPPAPPDTADTADAAASSGVALVTSDGAMAPQAAQALGGDEAASEVQDDTPGDTAMPPPAVPAATESTGDRAVADADRPELPEPAPPLAEPEPGTDGGDEREASPASAVPTAPVQATSRPARAAGRRSKREPQPAPSFVKQADRAARWQRPGVRAALLLLLLTGCLGLAGQAAFVYRDRLAASVPASRALLLHACASLGCRIGEYRQIDALTVESSGLTRVDGAPVYRLALTLRNRATHEVAAPALDLAIGDAQGRPIARRVLTMNELGLPLRSLRPGSEIPITAPLAVDGQVSSYTVEIFYP